VQANVVSAGRYDCPIKPQLTRNSIRAQSFATTPTSKQRRNRSTFLSDGRYQMHTSSLEEQYVEF
jgi:hypothetical protein